MAALRFTLPDFATLIDPPFAAHKEGENYSLKLDDINRLQRV